MVPFPVAPQLDDRCSDEDCSDEVDERIEFELIANFGNVAMLETVIHSLNLVDQVWCCVDAFF